MEDENYVCEVIVGTYEEYLLGYKFLKIDKEYRLTHTIANHSHKASLRSVASFQNYLASGGVDECIHLYDLHLRKECGLLMHHSGTITCLSFTPDGHYLMSGSEDGSISMFAVGSWVVDKVWPKAHKGKAVNHISIHPSGKMALSVGADSTLRTWNLVKGRSAYIVNLASKCKRSEIIEWALCGDYFGLVNESNLDVYSVNSAKIVNTLQLKSKISCIRFLKENRVCLGTSEGEITCLDFLTTEEVWCILIHEKVRIKCLSHFGNWLVSANSQGTLSVYEISKGSKPVLAATLETACRITSLTVSHASDDKTLIRKKNKKLKRDITFKVNNANDDEEAKDKKLGPSETTVHCYPLSQKWKVDVK